MKNKKLVRGNSRTHRVEIRLTENEKILLKEKADLKTDGNISRLILTATKYYFSKNRKLSKKVQSDFKDCLIDAEKSLSDPSKNLEDKALIKRLLKLLEDVTQELSDERS